MTEIVGGVLLVASSVMLGLWATRLSLARRAAFRLSAGEATTAARARPNDRDRDEGTISWWAAPVLPVRAIVGIAAIAGLSGALVAAAGLGFSLRVSLALGLDTAILVHLALTTRRARRLHEMESQLAEALRLTAAGLRAGMGRVDALRRAAEQIRRPLGPLLLEAVGRLRLGDAPEAAFGHLAARLPLETFRLFALVVAAQWQAGGSLQGTLASVGDFMQDRVDVAHRLESQAAPTRSSVLVLMGATAAIAWFSWSHDPANLERFLRSDAGDALVSATLALQGLSLLWMGRLMRTPV